MYDVCLCGQRKRDVSKLCRKCAYAAQRSTYRDRFESKFAKTDGCWLWQGTVNNRWGYGQFFANRKTYRAHRFSYEFFKGAIPAGADVCHTCDVCLCVNPDHLWLGTQKENSQDMVRKKRSLVGAKNSQARLRDDEIIEMRQLRLGGMPQADLARIYGIKQPHVSDIINRKKWAHVA